MSYEQIVKGVLELVETDIGLIFLQIVFGGPNTIQKSINGLSNIFGVK